MGRVKNVYTDMTKRIAQQTGLFEHQVRAVVLAFVRNVISDLSLGKSVHVMSLGKFYIKRMGARKIFDPFRGKPDRVGDRYIPRFTFGRRVLEFIKRESLVSLGGQGTQD